MTNKEIILEACKHILSERMKHAEHAMREAQESSNSEEKSSAGDKYETGRAMGHLNRDMNAKQLAQARAAFSELHQIDLSKSNRVQKGSLLTINGKQYFVAIGIGTVKTTLGEVIVLSPTAPITKAIWHLSASETVLFNGQKLTIETIE